MIQSAQWTKQSPQSVLQPTGLLVSTDADIAELSDNRSRLAPYAVSGGRGTESRVSKGRKANRLQLQRTQLTLKDKKDVQRYQDILSEKFSAANLENKEPEEIIHHLSKLSNEAVQEAQPDKTHKPGFHKYSTITHWAHFQHDQEAARRRKENHLPSALKSMVDKGSPHTVEMVMAVPEAKKRHK